MTTIDPASAIGEIGLLCTEVGVVRSTDDPRPLRGTDDVVVALAAHGARAVVAGDRLPDEVVARVGRLVQRAEPGANGAGVPPAVEACVRLLADAGFGVRQASGGPSYLVRPPLRLATDVPVLRSDEPGAAELLDHRAPTWAPVEWVELVGGGAGAPWAMVIVDGRVVSICHSARLTAAGAEAGTWTDGRYRGRGYAATTTAAWADLAAHRCDRLFYSTNMQNRSSQRVAERLGLRRLGTLWTVARG